MGHLRTMRGVGATVAVTLGLMLGLGVGCGHSEHHEEEHVAYPVTHPLRRDTDIVSEYVAQIRAVQHIEVRAMERGYLQEIFVDEGQFVQEGQAMFQIMPMLYQAEFLRSKAEANFAEIEYQNTRTLQESNVVSPNELALAKAKLDKANAEKSLANAHLNLAAVHAPFDGIMNRLEVRKGSLVEEGELLTSLSDNREMWVYFNVTEAEYLDFKEKVADDEPVKVKLMMANNKLFKYDGEVRTIEADFNNETGNIAFRATFPNPDGLLRHGETGKVLMTNPIENALLVPQKATFDILDKKFVFVVDEEGTVHQRLITVAEELPHLYVVSEGLTQHDQILLEGLRKVRDGMEIGAEYEEPEAVIAKLDVPAE